MDMTYDIMQKIERGDALTDDELAVAHAHFTQTAKLLDVLGPKFHLAWRECEFRSEELAGYIRNRKLMV